MGLGSLTAGVLVMRVRDRKLIHVRDYLDALTINHAFGRLLVIVVALAADP